MGNTRTCLTMLIKFKGKEDLIFNNYDDFYDYVSNNIIKYLKCDSKLEIFYNDHKNDIVNGIKIFRKIIRELYYNVTFLNVDYWLSRGWSYTESVNKIKEIQTINKDISVEKQSKLKRLDYHKWCENQNTHIEYYIKRGMSEEDALEYIKKRQKTFSLDICINKYGIDGINIWKERQRNWYNKIKDIEVNKDSNSPTFQKNKYGDNWIFNAIDNVSFLNTTKEIIKEIIKKTGNDFEFFIKEYNNIKDVISMKEVIFILQSKILQDFFGKNYYEMSYLIQKTLNIKIKSFGTIRYFNNHICRSNGEYYIAKKLKKLNIDYIYEKRYPNSRYICDFYIPKLDLYVEYLGLINKYTIIHHNDIYTEYKLKYDKKETFCKDNNINYLYNTNVVEITKTIIEKYDKN